MADDNEKGRLIKESNPVPGSRPGFTPQHDSSGDEDYVITSPVNPLPVTGVSGVRVVKSTDFYPEGKEGDTLFAWDTLDAYINDGKEWRKI